MYLIVTFYPISFLSKSEVAKVPVFGRITTNVQSIYIERNDESARDKIVQNIKERITKFMEKAKENLYEKVYPLIIFPEGTTSNGKSLLKFKVGAFNDLAPLTIVGLKYTCNFDIYFRRQF
jgi:1-acyl-sn-glycerol-3-phosphate acyltransferase